MAAYYVSQLCFAISLLSPQCVCAAKWESCRHHPGYWNRAAECSFCFLDMFFSVDKSCGGQNHHSLVPWVTLKSPSRMPLCRVPQLNSHTLCVLTTPPLKKSGPPGKQLVTKVKYIHEMYNLTKDSRFYSSSPEMYATLSHNTALSAREDLILSLPYSMTEKWKDGTGSVGLSYCYC